MELPPAKCLIQGKQSHGGFKGKLSGENNTWSDLCHLASPCTAWVKSLGFQGWRIIPVGIWTTTWYLQHKPNLIIFDPLPKPKLQLYFTVWFPTFWSIHSTWLFEHLADFWPTKMASRLPGSAGPRWVWRCSWATGSLAWGTSWPPSARPCPSTNPFSALELRAEELINDHLIGFSVP